MQVGLPDYFSAILLEQRLHFMQDALGSSGWYFVQSRKKDSRFLPDAYRLLKNICDQLLQGTKELRVPGPLNVAGPNPRSVDQTGKQMPIE